MPTFGDMLEVVDLLQVKAIEVEPDKCVAVRNRNSKCRKCADACIADAIEIGRNELKIDNSACVNCGCCVSVCPNNALHAVEPTEAKVESEAAKRSIASAGCAVVACARKAAKREGDPEKYAEVPCLGHLNEVQLVRMAAAGLDDIVLVDGSCASCKYGAASPRIDAMLANTEKLLDACGSDAIVTRTSEFPPEVLDKARTNATGKSRRGLLRQTGSYMKTVAGNVAQKTIDEQLGRSTEPATLSARLSAGKSGRMPTFEPEHNYRLIEAMQKLEERSGADTCETFSTRHFGNVEIDADNCSGCGMCVMFCPTAALKYAEYDEPSNEDRRYLEFQAADCTQCMLCKDVCLRYCLEVSPKVTLEEVTDFEPRLVEIANPANTTSFASLRARNKRS